jgi:hypothetical protein
VSWVARLVAAGLALAAVLAAVAGASRGADALFASACGSVIALVAQVAAVGLLRPAMGARTPAFMGRWAAGMAVRGASFVTLALMLVLLRGSLPVLWIAVGYVGVLLPLLFVETRFLK